MSRATRGRGSLSPSWTFVVGLVAALALAAAGCGGGSSESGAAGPGAVDPGPVDPGPVDPGPVDPRPVDPGPSEPRRPTAVLAVTDFQVLGFLATLDLTTFAVESRLAEISADPVVRVAEPGRVHVVNRFQFDNLQIFDPADGFTTVAQWSTGNGSNPHDVVVIGDEAFITRYEPPFDDVLVMGLADGSTRATIDLLPFADTATDPAILPRPHLMTVVDGRIYALLQHFDPTFQIVGEGSVAVIDPATRTVVDVIELGASNPNGLGLPMFSLRIRWPSSSMRRASSSTGPRMS